MLDSSSSAMPKKSALWLTGGIIGGLVVVAIIIAVARGGFDWKSFAGNSMKTIPANQAAEQLVSFINEANKVYAPQSSPITLQGVTEEHGLYKVMVQVTDNGQTESQSIYVTRDGALFIPQGIDIKATMTQLQQTPPQAVPTSTPAAKK